MRASKIKKLRQKIQSPNYWAERLEYVKSEAQWYYEEYMIRHVKSDLRISNGFKRKVSWYEKKAEYYARKINDKLF